MKTLHRYLLRQTLVTVTLTTMVCVFVLLLGNVLQDVLALVVGGQVSFGLAAKAMGLLIPFVLAFALPLGFLTAMLLVFGRFSADQELTAARANGISLLSLVAPIILLSLGFCLLSGWINLYVAPKSRVEYKRLKDEITLQRPMELLEARVFIDHFPGYSLYIGDKEGDELRGIYLSKFGEDGELTELVRAARGTIETDSAKREIRLQLNDAQALLRGSKGWHPFYTEEASRVIQLGAAQEGLRQPKISEMTFTQLLAERKKKEAAGEDSMPVQVHLHRQLAGAFACLGFTLVGIPLGIRAHRRETLAGIAMALGLVLLYYSFVTLGRSLETRPDLMPHLIIWAPNFIFQALGITLLWRANRGV